MQDGKVKNRIKARQKFPKYEKKIISLSLSERAEVTGGGITKNIDGFVKSPSAAFRFNFVVAAHLVGAPHSSVFARIVPPVAGELFTKPSFQ